MKTKIFTAIFLLMGISLFAQNVNNIQMPELLNKNSRKTINIPDILGYQTLKCDFHMHTVFSDGSVCPTIRVDEAYNEGLDVIAITDHIERNPSKKDVAGDDNSSYEIALPRAQQKNIILIKAGEITRSMAPGHFNALFLNDTQALDVENWRDAFAEAKKQGAYFIWNHPGWKAQQPDTCLWWDEHTELFENGMLHAIEVFNEKEWYPIALDWCMDKNIAPHAASDIHGINSEMYNLKDYHRPMTLVLAKERTQESIREALFANRTVAYFGNILAGKEEYLKAIFEASVKIEFYREYEKGKTYIIANKSDVPFVLSSEEDLFTIPANGETMVNIPNGFNNRVEVKNLHVKGTKNLKLKLEL
ncbi:PHP domain-containing protein [Draconibacterium mangrovi]|uniref:histidinol-phosphatase n=1 Tax=Draconibacterium mangrovi TaxID=2697469 RepID=UPI0013D831A1|nr:histidinol-phosphatase [Draconibacterium mangrovi]